MTSGSRRRRPIPMRIALLAVLAVGLASPGRSQEPSSGGSNPFAELKWRGGPMVAEFGNVAQLQLPAGYVHLDKRDTRRFLELSQNIPDGDELGLIAPAAQDQTWFVIFSFQKIGFVKDDEKEKLDADAILTSLREGTERGNQERKKRGWPLMTVVGWRVSPAYDAVTHNLEWAVEGRASDSPEVSVNHSTRVLGREGVMNVALVCGSDDLVTAAAQLKTLLKGFSFAPGKKYAEFREGDQIAAVGLTGLIAGGAAVAAVKTGFFAKFLKPLLIGLFALVAALGRWLMGLFGRKAEEPKIG